jgi:hypothetical protein
LASFVQNCLTLNKFGCQWRWAVSVDLFSSYRENNCFLWVASLFLF